VAEETGLISAIGEWVLRETCRQGKAWLDAGLPPLTPGGQSLRAPNSSRRSAATVMQITERHRLPG
jgi:EAL domain-containing protein (putative c-di-GMP-specific phosphodiesterase class I)